MCLVQLKKDLSSLDTAPVCEWTQCEGNCSSFLKRDLWTQKESTLPNIICQGRAVNFSVVYLSRQFIATYLRRLVTPTGSEK